MALQIVQGGIVLMPGIGTEGTQIPVTNGVTLNAAGESLGFIGELRWDDGATHTVSSAGGKIYIMFSGVTFAAAAGGTVIRVGIQDVDTTTGLEDAAFDTHDDLVSATDTITNSVIHTVTLSSGSKSIAHNALVAVVIEMTARTNPDAVNALRVSAVGSGFPYTTSDTGTLGKASSGNLPLVMVQADDGALGIYSHAASIPYVATETSFNSGSATDEYAMIFQVPFKCEIDHLIAYIGEIDTGETGDILLYSAPTTTPVLEATASLDPEVFGIVGASTGYTAVKITPFTASPATDYAVAYQATSAGNRLIRRITSIPGANARKFTPFGTTLLGGVRADATGAFTTSTTDWPCLGFMISKLDDGAGGSSGAKGRYGWTHGGVDG